MFDLSIISQIVITLAVLAVIGIISVFYQDYSHSGKWIVKKKLETLHECNKPNKFYYENGSIWQCKCNQVWKLYKLSYPEWKKYDLPIQKE